MIPFVKELVPLEYGKGRGPWSGAAIAALSVGLCSGPLAVWIIWHEDAGYAIQPLGDMTMAACGLISILFCSFVYVRLGRPESRRGRGLAMAGIIATVLWALTVFALLAYVDAQLN